MLFEEPGVLLNSPLLPLRRPLPKLLFRGILIWRALHVNNTVMALVSQTVMYVLRRPEL